MAKFQVGQPRPMNSGRQKGAPNTKTLVLREALEYLGHDIPTKITELLPQLPVEKQVDVYLNLLQYVFPRRKAVEVTGHEGRPIEVITRKAISEMASDADLFEALVKIDEKLQAP